MAEKKEITYTLILHQIRKELKVSAIENGTVIDHIPSKTVFQVIKILNLKEAENQILFGTILENLQRAYRLQC